MQDSSMPHWSWSVPRTPRKRRGRGDAVRQPGTRGTHGGWVRVASPAKCAPTVFIGAPVIRRESGR